MRRLLLNTVTALSLLLFVAVVVLWVRSYWCRDGVTWSSGSNLGPIKGWSIISQDARLWFVSTQHWRVGNLDPHDLAPRVLQWGQYWVPASFQVAGALPFGFNCHSDTTLDSGFEYSWFHVGIPHWLVALLLATSTAFLLRSFGRARQQDQRRRQGRCAACGYDLRASPERCPECGAMPPRVETRENATPVP